MLHDYFAVGHRRSVIIYNMYHWDATALQKIEEINGVTLVKFGREKVKSYVSDSDKILGIRYEIV